MGSAETTCMTTECDREAFSRGLCRRCYWAAWSEINADRTTWENLEAAGLVKPPKTRGRKRLPKRSPWKVQAQAAGVIEEPTQ